MLAISMDDAETLKRFKEELKTPFAFIADPQGKIVDQYDVKGAVAMAKRYTFVVGQDRKIVDVQSGADAVDPLKSIAACPLHKDKSPAKTKSTEAPKKG